ncbi:ComEA family DNA-binding protein [Mannheimia varigena]|nr:ComEA family DNA-binding protein [Mannheimia varigena]MDY2947359.1 ComEA family DNA-binding protein [Mannheimia varigena]
MKQMKTLALGLLMSLNTFAFAQTPPQIEQNSMPQTEQQVTQINTNAVNINTASAAELQDKLVGIGEKKAQAIVDYRTKNGNFKSIEQLAEVSGIGQATVEKNRANIVLE